MGADEAVCIDSDEEHSATGKKIHFGQSSKAAAAPLDLCIDSDDEDIAIQQAPVVFVLPSSGQPYVFKSAVAPLQANAAKHSPRKRKITKHVDICIDSDGELIGSDNDGDMAIGSASGLPPTAEKRRKLLKVQSLICEAVPMEKHTAMPVSIASEPLPCSTIETAVHSCAEPLAPLPTPISRAVDIACTPACVDTDPAREIRRESVGSVDSELSHQSSASNGLDAVLEDPDDHLERQAQAMAEKVLEKLTLTDDARARRILKVKDGILKRLKSQQPVEPPPPLVEASSVSPSATIAERQAQQEIQVPTTSVPQQAVATLGFRDILALAEAQTQAFVRRSTDPQTEQPPVAPQPASEPRELRHPRSLHSGSGLRGGRAPQAPSFAKRHVLRRWKTRAEREKEYAGLTGGRRRDRPPPPVVHAAEAEEDPETTIVFREAEREKRRALLGGSEKRRAQASSANGWEHQRLGSSAEKRKFLRLMGGAELAGGGAGEDGSGSEEDLPTDCPTIELGAGGDWVAVAEGSPEGEGMAADLEQMFKRGLKQTWSKGRGLGA